MNEQEYIERLKEMWPHGCDASLESIALVDEALSAFPCSIPLWCMRGHLIQLGPKECPHPLDEALASYRRVAELDPQCAEAWDEIGHYTDAVLADEAGAAPFFEKARQLRARQKAEPGAPPNGDPAERFGSTGAGGGPPSVS